MSLFDLLGFGGKKVEPLPTIEPDSNFPDTVLDEKFVEVTEVDAQPAPVAAWPFPVGGHPKEGPGAFEAKPAFDPQEEAKRRAALYGRIADERREERDALKELVKEAPEHGIHFYHAGKTTIAWRHHNWTDAVEGYVRNKRLIDISTAICNPRDQFSKWQGSAYAMQAMLDGRYITVKIRPDDSKRDKPLSDMVVIQDRLELIGLAIET